MPPARSNEPKLTPFLSKHKRLEIKRSSFDRLESIINGRVIPEIGYVQIGNLNQSVIQDLIQKQVDEGMSYSTVKKVREAVNACCTYGVRMRYLKDNPCQFVTVPRALLPEEKVVRALSTEEIAALKKELERTYSTGAAVYRYADAFTLILNTGMRLGEALGLKIGDFDKEKRTLSIARNLTAVGSRAKDGSRVAGSEFIEQSPKSKAGRRIIPLNDTAYGILVRLIGNRIKGTDFIVITQAGKHVSTTMFAKSFGIAAAAAGIGRCGVHMLRHTFATEMLSRGVEIKTVSEILGHSNVSITYNTYIHVIQQQKAAAVKLVEL